MLVQELYEIGNRFLYFRKKLGLTQAEVAEKASMSDRTYADIERGTVNMRMLTFLKICAALHIEPDEVLTRRDIDMSKKEEEILERLKLCSPKDKGVALNLIEVYLKALRDE